MRLFPLPGGADDYPRSLQPSSEGSRSFLPRSAAAGGVSPIEDVGSDFLSIPLTLEHCSFRHLARLFYPRYSTPHENMDTLHDLTVVLGHDVGGLGNCQPAPVPLFLLHLSPFGSLFFSLEWRPWRGAFWLRHVGPLILAP